MQRTGDRLDQDLADLGIALLDDFFDLDDRGFDLRHVKLILECDPGHQQDLVSAKLKGLDTLHLIHLGHLSDQIAQLLFDLGQGPFAHQQRFRFARQEE